MHGTMTNEKQGIVANVKQAFRLIWFHGVMPNEKQAFLFAYLNF